MKKKDSYRKTGFPVWRKNKFDGHFSFTSAENALMFNNKIALENLETDNNFPLRGFTLPVETLI